jgi:hypothetical protein
VNTPVSSAGRTLFSHLRWLLLTGVISATSLALTPAPALANHSAGDGGLFTFLQPGFTQDLYATHLPFVFGVSFAPDGDPMVNLSGFYRVDSQGVEANSTGDELHPVTSLGQGGCIGVVNHPDGLLYSNDGSSSGITGRNPNTGAVVKGPFGNASSCLGIAVDPQTGNIVYADGSSGLSYVNQAFTATGVWSSHATGYDGINFDPTGNFLFGSSGGGLTVLRRNGSFVQQVNLAGSACCTDGIAFHATPPRFVVSSNTDGTMTRFDFPGDDYTQTPVQSIFAISGFYGDLSNAGPDGCLYVSMGGTRFEDGTTSGEGSLGRICGGFAPPPGAGAEGPFGDANCADGVDNDGDGLTDASDPDCQGPSKNGKVSARGTVTSDHGTATFSAATDCTAASSTKPSIVDWNNGGAKRFTKTSVTSSKCFDNTTPAGTPAAGFDTQVGKAAGTITPGGASATLEWVYVDGAPGGAAADKVRFVIKNSSGNPILTVGNQSANSLSGTVGGVWTFAP